MQKFNIILLILCFMWASCQSHSEVEEAVNGLQVESKLNQDEVELIYQYMKDFPNHTCATFAFVKNDEVRYFGLKRNYDTLSYFDSKHRVYEIGSITKVFTGVVLSQFVENGKLNLNEPINPYLDFPLKDSIQITFGSLANHTSGLARMPANFNLSSIRSPRNPHKYYDEDNLKKYLSGQLKLYYKPGSKSSYSNLGMGLLAHSLSKISNQSYQELVDSLIFSKYSMHTSTFEYNDIAHLLVKGLNDKGKVTPNWEAGALIGASGAYSNVEDMAQFAKAQFDSANSELALAREVTFKQDEGLELGLGWHILKRDSGSKWHWHNGGTGGYTSSMAVNMAQGKAVIVLSNVSAYHPETSKIDQLCFQLMKKL